ncbi:MAG: hypothetical protein J3Q66DRAFT_113394 [Benniella sp.]|nr:MAG: hypothetical protein J3Q66DRAFT_113394 [Benniella sp.]
MASNRIVTSTIIRPDGDAQDSRKKRSFPDAPEPARRNTISSRLGSLSGSSHSTTTSLSTTSSSTANNHGSTTEATAAVGTSSNDIDITSGEPSTVMGESSRTGEDMDMNEGRENDYSGENQDRAKRVRTSLNPAEDAKRGRRMMGMILGTLTQFKKQETMASGEAKSSGVASREALQERVREKLRKEQELNAEMRKKERDAREERLKQQQANRQAGRRPNQRRSLILWENGYLLTETRPRLRYMPKIMNEEMRKKHEAQIKETGEGAPFARQSTSVSTATASASDSKAETAAGMELDLEDVAMEVVVDVKDAKNDKNVKDINNETPGSITSSDNSTSQAATLDSNKDSNDVDMAEGPSKGSAPAEQEVVVEVKAESEMISISLV